MERVARSEPRRSRGSLWGVEGVLYFPDFFCTFPGMVMSGVTRQERF